MATTISTRRRRRPRSPSRRPPSRTITRYFEATGNTAAVNSVDLVARVQGFIQEISYTDGDFVKKGTLLFTIEPEPYQLKLQQAQAAEAGAQATLKQAEAEYKRQAELASKQFASQAVLDQARRRSATARRRICSRRRPTPSRRRSISTTPR